MAALICRPSVPARRRFRTAGFAPPNAAALPVPLRFPADGHVRSKRSVSRIDDNLPRGSIEQHPLLVEHVTPQDAFLAGGNRLNESRASAAIDLDLTLVEKRCDAGPNHAAGRAQEACRKETSGSGTVCGAAVSAAPCRRACHPTEGLAGNTDTKFGRAGF